MASAADTTRFRVTGMDCASCASKIDSAVRTIEGVQDVSVSVVAGTMTLVHAPAADLDAVANKVVKLGYAAAKLPPKASGSAAVAEPANHDHDDHEGHDHASHDRGAAKATTPADALEGLHGHDHAIEDGPWWATKKARLTVFSAIAVAMAFAVGKAVPQVEQLVFIAAMLVGLVRSRDAPLSARSTAAPSPSRR